MQREDKPATLLTAAVFETLPLPYRPDANRMFVEPAGDEQRAVVTEYMALTNAARQAALALAKELGAVSFMEPWTYGDDAYPTCFAFEQRPPKAKGWNATRPTSRSPYWKGTAAKGPAGDALRERFAALPKYPGANRLDAAVSPISSISYRFSGGGWGGTSVGGFDPINVCFTGERVFVYFPNHYRTLHGLLREDGPVYIEHQDGVDPTVWRVPAGWTLRSKAEVDLIFAENAVRREREAA